MELFVPPLDRGICICRSRQRLLINCPEIEKVFSEENADAGAEFKPLNGAKSSD